MSSWSDPIHPSQDIFYTSVLRADWSFCALIELCGSGVYLFPDAAHAMEGLGAEASQSLQITWDDPTGRSVPFYGSGTPVRQTPYGQNLLKTIELKEGFYTTN